MQVSKQPGATARTGSDLAHAAMYASRMRPKAQQTLQQWIMFKYAGVDLIDPLFADPSLMNERSFIGPENSLWQLRKMRVPVIAAVAGPCITGGMELALNCDIIIASPSAFFQDTHARYGIVPGGGMTTLLPKSVGTHAAKWASLACQRIAADRAYQLGLVAKVSAGLSIPISTMSCSPPLPCDPPLPCEAM